jgi:hypothetical protein
LHATTCTDWKWKKRFHKKQGYGGHYYMKCGKGSLYFIHPCVPINLWEWWSLGCMEPTPSKCYYVVKFPFIEIFYCACECTLQGNMCKHQIVVILTCTDIY